MVINEARLISFGKYNKAIIEFNPKLNIIYGENEAGKSTVYYFLDAMIDAIHMLINPDFEGKDIFKKYVPWNNEQEFVGELIFTYRGEVYRVVRNFLEGRDKIELYKELSGSFLKISAVEEAFNLQMVGIKTLTAASGSELVHEMREKVKEYAKEQQEEDVYEYVREEIKRREEKMLANGSYVAVTTGELDIAWDLIENKTYSKQAKFLYKKREEKVASKRIQKKEIQKVKEDIQQAKDKIIARAYEKFYSYNQQKKELQNEIKTYESYKNLNFNDYDAYVDETQKASELKAISENLAKEVNDIKASIEEEKRANGYGYSNKLSNEKYADQFFNELEQYKKALVDQERVHTEIHEIEERLSQVKEVDVNDSAMERLEREYYRFLHLQNMGNRLEEEKRQDTKVDENNRELAYYRKHRYNLLTSIFLVIILSAIFINLEFFMKEGYVAFQYIGYATLGLLVPIILLLLRVNYKYSQYDYIRTILQSKTKEREYQQKLNENEIQDILAKYNIHSEEGFENFFTESQEAKRIRNVLDRDLRILVNRKGELRTRLSTLTRHLNRRIVQCELGESIRLENIDEAILSFEKEIKKTEVIKNKEESLHEKQREIEEIRLALYEVNNELRKPNHIIFSRYSYEEVQNFKERDTVVREQMNIINDKIADLFEKYGENDIMVRGKLLFEDEKRKNELFEGEEHPSINQLNIQLQEKKDKVQYIDEEIAKLHTQIFELRSIKKQVSKAKRKVSVQTAEYKRIHKLLEYLALAERIIGKVSKKAAKCETPDFASYINRNIKEITQKYNEIIVTEEEELYAVEKDGSKVAVHDLSLGTIDQMYFAIRLGLIEALHEEDGVPIVLDDAFVQYDIDRFHNIMKIVCKLDRQVIIMSCYEREQEYVQENKIACNYMNLT